jgi:nucleotidyltransferase-like protein
MSADDYLKSLLNREAVDTGILSPVRGVQTIVEPALREWAGQLLNHVRPSGSFAKGTANKSGTDIDLFISLSQETTETLKEIYESLFNKMKEKGYNPTRQNVSINIRVNCYDVDLVPAKRQDSYSDDHSLYRRRAGTWTKTNVTKHIAHVINGGRLSESRIVKLWRNQNKLEFPSFYLELAVIDALSGQYFGSLSDNVWKVFSISATLSRTRVWSILRIPTTLFRTTFPARNGPRSRQPRSRPLMLSIGARSSHEFMVSSSNPCGSS